MALLKHIFSIKNTENHKIIEFFWIRIKIRRRAADVQRPIEQSTANLQQQIEQRTVVLQKQIDSLSNLWKTIPAPTLYTFGVDVVDHCNLGCWGCDHFSPLADPNMLDPKEFAHDCKRLAELSESNVDVIRLMGGEPLLHPNLLEICRIARNYFPHSTIFVLTNGILLKKMDQSFWNVCHENKITIRVTKYPIKLDFDSMEKRAAESDVLFTYYNKSEVIKTSYKIPLDPSGRQNPIKNWLDCFHVRNCVTLRHGKIYPCTPAPSIEHFNKYFKMNIPLHDRDGIDIHKAKSMEDILAFLSKPIPFCRFCNVPRREFGKPWSRTEKQITEWT